MGSRNLVGMVEEVKDESKPSTMEKGGFGDITLSNYHECSKQQKNS